jgi:hypothetical protein
MFLVKSAYQMALKQDTLSQDRGATSARPDVSSPSWKLIWQCPVPPKVKLLAWKICKKSLATQVNLQRHHMTTTGTCQICGKEEEDTMHVFLRCPHARDLWRPMGDV